MVGSACRGAVTSALVVACALLLAALLAALVFVLRALAVRGVARAGEVLAVLRREPPRTPAVLVRVELRPTPRNRRRPPRLLLLEPPRPVLVLDAAGVCS